MNYRNLLEQLSREAGGWDAFEESVRIDAGAFRQILGMAEVQDPAEGEERPSRGRLGILQEGVRRGDSLAAVQEQLYQAGRPALYSRNGCDAAVIYLLDVGQSLPRVLGPEEKAAGKLRLQWMKALQQQASCAMEAQRGQNSGPEEARRQNQALAALHRALFQGTCRYQDLVDYLNGTFSRKAGVYQTVSVTAAISSLLDDVRANAREELDKLPAGVGAEAAWNCLEKYWQNFLDQAAPTLAANQMNVLNYLVRSLVRWLDYYFTALAVVTVRLRPAVCSPAQARDKLQQILADPEWAHTEVDKVPLEDALVEDRPFPAEDDVSFERDLLWGEEWQTREAVDYTAVLTALFSQDRSAQGVDDLIDELTEKDRWQDLSAALRPFFCFYRAGAPQPAGWIRQVAAAKTYWAGQTLYLSGVTRLLLAMVDPGGNRGHNTRTHQKEMQKLYTNSGSYLARVLRGTADMDRNSFLLFLLLAEDGCERRMPAHEQLTARLYSPDQNYSDLLEQCGFHRLSPCDPFDAALLTALEVNPQGTRRKQLFLKALLVCEQIRQKLQEGQVRLPPALRQDASEFHGLSPSLEQAFHRLNLGRHAGHYPGRD